MDRFSRLTHDYFNERGDSKTVNYEALYFLASQVADDRSDLQNSALSPFLGPLRQCSRMEPAKLGDETHNFIDDVIRTELSTP